MKTKKIIIVAALIAFSSVICANNTSNGTVSDFNGLELKFSNYVPCGIEQTLPPINVNFNITINSKTYHVEGTIQITLRKKSVTVDLNITTPGGSVIHIDGTATRENATIPFTESDLSGLTIEIIVEGNDSIDDATLADIINEMVSMYGTDED